MPAAKIQFSDLTEKNKRNFWRRVNKDGPIPDQENPHYTGLDKCWMWTGALKQHNYGEITILHKNCTTHRISWMLHNGDIPEGKHVCHRCDNPQCCNPAHLFLGTIRENAHDCISKGRKNAAFGERAGRAKLTAEIVIEMRRRSSEGETYLSLGRLYGVSGRSARAAVMAESWKHIVEPKSTSSKTNQKPKPKL